jgi:NhaP-type Na+/H+ or K+/H+ antiporter
VVARNRGTRVARSRNGFTPTCGFTHHSDDGLRRLRATGRPSCSRRDRPSEHELLVRTLAEATLAFILFSDASRIDLGQLRRSVGVPSRLLGLGLPLTIALGALVASLIFDQLTVGEAVVLGVILAPTDAALGQAVLTERRVPARIRQGLNVESGLNDGICVPLLFAAVAIADVESNIAGGRGATSLLLEEVGYGVLGGILAGPSSPQSSFRPVAEA